MQNLANNIHINANKCTCENSVAWRKENKKDKKQGGEEGLNVGNVRYEMLNIQVMKQNVKLFS